MDASLTRTNLHTPLYHFHFQQQTGPRKLEQPARALAVQVRRNRTRRHQQIVSPLLFTLPGDI